MDRRLAGVGRIGRAPRAGAGGHTILTPASILGAAYHSDWRADDPNRLMNGSKVAGLFNYGHDASDALEADVNFQMIYTAAAVNGGPGLIGGTKGLVATLNTPIVAGDRPYYWLIAQLSTTSQYSYMLFAGDPSDTALVIRNGTFEDRLSGDTNTTGGAPDTALHLFEWSFDGTNRLLVDGSVVIAGARTSPGVATHGLLCGPSSNSGAAAIFVREICALDPTPTQVANMRSYLRGPNFPNYAGSSYGLS